jgi:NADH-quinone oxidoreductase subunit J
MHLILFFLFAGFCLAGAINLLLQSHPINSALSLIVVMTSLAVLYLLLGAEFLAAAQVIVYAGAIMVLFVFTVMLLNAGREERTMGSRVGRAVGFPAVVVVLGVIATVVLTARGIGDASLRDGITSTQDLSRVLFHELLLPFEVTSVLILIAILGAVALARHGHGDPNEHPRRKAEPKNVERMAAK